jgi:hypothetical protein
MHKLLVNTPQGQVIIVVGEGGGYFDKTKVLWDERLDGPFPPGMLPSVGGLIRSGNNLLVDPQALAAHQAKVAEAAQAKVEAAQKKAARLAKFKTIDTLTTLPEVKAAVKDLLIELGYLEG